jgi:hypothetical protein
MRFPISKLILMRRAENAIEYCHNVSLRQGSSTIMAFSINLMIKIPEAVISNAVSTS